MSKSRIAEKSSPNVPVLPRQEPRSRSRTDRQASAPCDEPNSPRLPPAAFQRVDRAARSLLSSAEIHDGNPLRFASHYPVHLFFQGSSTQSQSPVRKP